MASPQAAGQTQVDLVTNKDVTLYESDDANPLANGAGENFFVGTTGQTSNAIRRSLIAFDLNGEIPAGATIQTVELTLRMTKAPQATSFDLSLHRVLKDWGEGNSDASGGSPGFQEGDGTTPMAGDATWFDAVLNTSAWQTPGGDFDGTPSSTTAVGSNGTYVWGSTSEMIADVQAWVDDPSQNFGWALVGVETSSRTVKTFSSREGTTPPNLKVTFTTSTAAEGAPEAPSSVALLSSYPNPFTRYTTVEYTVSEARQVRLDVYDTLGRRVATLVEGFHPSGSYAARFDAEDLPVGAYFYRIASGNFSKYSQVVLVR
jgi:hypothetical protein